MAALCLVNNVHDGPSDNSRNFFQARGACHNFKMFHIIFSDMACEDPGTSDREPEGPLAIQLRRERRAFILSTIGEEEAMNLPNPHKASFTFQRHSYSFASLPPRWDRLKQADKRTDISKQV